MSEDFGYMEEEENEMDEGYDEPMESSDYPEMSSPPPGARSGPSGRPTRYGGPDTSGRPSRYGEAQPGERRGPQAPVEEEFQRADPDLPYRLASQMWAGQMNKLVEGQLSQVESLDRSAGLVLLASSPLGGSFDKLRMIGGRYGRVGVCGVDGGGGGGGGVFCVGVYALGGDVAGGEAGA